MSFDRAVRYLKERDVVIARLIAQVGRCKLPRTRTFFIALVEAILWQQISWKAACAIHARMLKALGTRHPTPRDVLGVSRRTLLDVGLSRQKATYLVELARFFDTKRFPHRHIHRYEDEEIIELLTQIKGIGRWSAEMFLIFGLNRPDVFPAGDLGLRKAMARHYGHKGLPGDGELSAISDGWRPYRTIATWYLWASGDEVPLSAG